MASTLIGRQAVVVGAGMAGLPAARALADYFEHVIVLERDILPFDATQRAGTPIRMGSSPVASRRSPSFFRDLSRTSPAPVRCRSGLASIFASRCPVLILFLGAISV
jgi:glycine/D-amino acid oxidase-like deaminating enzyme